MREKVLVIDDVAAIHDLLKVRLRNEALEFHSAYDGPTGLTMAATVQPDLILLDVEMPPPDGFEICKRLTADLLTQHIPIIFLTAASDTEKKICGLELGAVDYITKPFDIAELRARVRATLRTKYLMDLLSKKAMIDALTGLWNRAYLDQRVLAELALSRRHQRPLACIMADLDHFKTINDRFGHHFGDVVLRAVARALQESCRTEDIVCRYGGEEFALLLPNTAAVGALELADRLHRAVETVSFEPDGTEVKVTCSFGVAELHGEQPPSLLELADTALYRAKHQGRNQVVLAN